MSRRLFILTNDPVPFGTANANYIRNFAKAVATTSMEVIVIGMKSSPNNSQFYCSDVYKRIQFWNFNESKCGSKNYLLAYFNYKKNYLNALNYFKAGKDDYIVVYSTELDTARAAIEYSLVPCEHKAFCEVEWFQPYQYKYGKLTPQYILWKIGFQYRMKKFQKAIPISTNLEKNFIKNGCNTLVVPALVDTDNIRAERTTDDSYVHFIYPGSASDKDSFSCMMNALMNVDLEKRKRIKFHLTGSMSYEKLQNILGKDKDVLKELKNNLIFHGWLLYDELMDLYGKSDFLLIARAKNVVTLSNFPSKVPEMMSYGVVPVCSNVGDYTRIYLRDGIDSIQFEEDSINSCTEAICKAIEIKGTSKFAEMQKAARQTTVDKFDCRNWGKKIVDFLQK